MAATYTPNVRLAKPGDLDQGWGITLDGNYDILDALAPLKIFAVQPTEIPSTTLRVQVRGGNYKRVGLHQVNTVADAVIAVLPNQASKIYLNDSGITTNLGYPFNESFIPIAEVSADSSSIVSIRDERCPYLMTAFEITRGLDFPDDTAASNGGVKLGELYHTGGTVKIRRA